MTVKTDKFENFYFAIKIVATVLVLFCLLAGFQAITKDAMGLGMATVSMLVAYIVLIIAFVLFQKIYLIGYLKGNGVPISERQFPEVFAEYRKMGDELGIAKLPQLFLLQEGGLLNAFAIRFSGRNYLAIYSEVLSLIATDMDAVRFILGHELGHVSRHHMSKRFWTCPSSLVPFLTPAWSRRCELTCDNIGNAFAGDNPLNGLVLLAAGRDLYRKVDVASYVDDARRNYTASAKIVGLFMSHPWLPRRLRNLQGGTRG